MRILNGNELAVPTGRVQLRRTTAINEPDSLSGNSYNVASEADSTYELEMDVLRQSAYQEGLEKAEIELQRALTDLKAKFDKDTAILAERHETALGEIGHLAESLSAVIEQLKSDAFSACLELSFASIVKILGHLSADKTLINSLCKTVCEEYADRQVVIGLNRDDYTQINQVQFTLPTEICADVRPGQCRVMHSNGYDETGIDVRLEAIKCAFLSIMGRSNG